MPHLCARDVVIVKLDITEVSGDKRRVCSAYFPHDEESPPPEPVIKLVKYCQEKWFPLIVECDTNSHHTVRESTNTNEIPESC